MIFFHLSHPLKLDVYGITTHPDSGTGCIREALHRIPENVCKPWLDGVIDHPIDRHHTGECDFYHLYDGRSLCRVGSLLRYQLLDRQPVYRIYQCKSFICPLLCGALYQTLHAHCRTAGKDHCRHLAKHPQLRRRWHSLSRKHLNSNKPFWKSGSRKLWWKKKYVKNHEESECMPQNW